MNRSAFYASMRQRASGIFGTSISQSQVQGIEAILDEAERRGAPLQHLAYILATAYHESAYTMQAVCETLATSRLLPPLNSDRIQCFGNLFDALRRNKRFQRWLAILVEKDRRQGDVRPFWMPLNLENLFAVDENGLFVIGAEL